MTHTEVTEQEHQTVSSENESLQEERPNPVRTYVSAHPSTPSADLYDGLSRDPVMAELTKRKTLSYREITLVTSTVIAALDTEILRLREEAQFRTQVHSFLNGQLIKKSRQASEEDSDDSASPEEAAWVLKYLTLRNVGGILLIVLTSAAGFFAFINRHHSQILKSTQDHLNTVQGQYEAAIESNTALELKVQEAESLTRRKEAELDALDLRLQAGREDADRWEKESLQLRERLTSSQTAISSGEDTVESLQAKVIALEGQVKGEMDKTTEEVRKLGAAETNAGFWQQEHSQVEDQLTNSISRIGELERERATALVHQRNAVDAWNQLLAFMSGELRGGPKSSVRRHVKGLREVTKDVPGMKERLDG